jgi:hypothetical protein
MLFLVYSPTDDYEGGDIFENEIIDIFIEHFCRKQTLRARKCCVK